MHKYSGSLVELAHIAKVNAVHHLYIKAIISIGLSNHQTTQLCPPKTGQKPASLSGGFPFVTLMAFLAT